MSVKWIFDPAPPSGRRTGGSSAEYSFKGTIDILVREVVQNSVDARLSDDAPVKVTFRIVDLEGEFLHDFLTAAGWSTLEDNLGAIPENRGGRAIADCMARLQEEACLRLLIVEDRGTRGLSGTERRSSDTETNPFCALVRDELYSDKQQESAGGSFGLGKSLLWAYSGLKTVLFSSVPASAPKGFSGLRFIGRATLPWHETATDGECSGDGWFGHPVGADGSSRRADSVWGSEAEAVASGTLCARTQGDPGLSIVVIGFTEPGEEDRSAADLMDQISAAALESFWPALVKGDLDITVKTEENDEETATHVVRPEDVPGYRDLGELLGAYSSGALDTRQRLEPGHSAMALVPLELPKRNVHPTHSEVTASVAVLVHLFRPGEAPEAVVDRTFRFRGPGMVIRSEKRANLSLLARPYIAAVVAGTAAGAQELDHAAEAFLRAAEPPAHDEWTHNTRKVKQDYQAHGCKAKLERFEQAIRAAITRLISKPEEHGGQLPRSILRHLRFGDHSGGGNQRFLSVTHQKAIVAGNGWRFSARCRRVHPDDRSWHVSVHFKYARDGGGGDDVHAIGQVEAEGASNSFIKNGVGWLEFPADVTKVVINGRTDPDRQPAIGLRSVVLLRVDGAAGEIEDA